MAVPVKLGLSLNDYYEHPITGEDHAFGFFDIGVLVTIPISKVSSSFGSWNFHIGGDILWFGDTTKYFNNDESTKGLFSFGFGFILNQEGRVGWRPRVRGSVGQERGNPGSAWLTRPTPHLTRPHHRNRCASTAYFLTL